MGDEMIIRIGNKIREKRRARGLTLQELADKAEVSKGLISQIENGRIVPSLPALISIIHSLHFSLEEFFSNVDHSYNASRVLIRRREDYGLSGTDHPQGFFYRQILTRHIKEGPVEITLLELQRGAQLTANLKKDAFEYTYTLKGTIECRLGNDRHMLHEGDSLFFDGRLGRRSFNMGMENALVHMVCFFPKEME